MDIPGLSSVKIKNLLVKAIESSSNIRQYQVNFVRFGRLVQPKLYHRTKNEVIEVFISRQIKKCYKEFAGMHGLDKKTTPQTLRYKEKKGSLIEEVCINLPDGVAGTLAFELLKYTAKKLKKEFEKLIKDKTPPDSKGKFKKNEEQSSIENDSKATVQVNIGKLTAEDVTIIITE